MSAQIRSRLRGDVDWLHYAACLDTNPTIFHDPDRYKDALSVCAGCPVQHPCAQLRRPGDTGVWGGKAHYPRRQRLA